MPATRFVQRPDEEGRFQIRRIVELRLTHHPEAADWAGRVERWLITDGWLPIEEGWTPPDAVLLVAPDLKRDVAGVLAATEQVAPVPVLLLTGSSPSNLKELRRLVVSAVATEREIGDELGQQLTRISRASLREVLAECVRGCEGLDPMTRDIILAACTTSPPIRSRKKLLRKLNRRSPTTVWNRWRSVPSCLGGIADFLRTVALVHYVELRHSGLSAKRARQVVGISKTCLFEMTRRQFDTTPGRLTADPTALRQWVVEVTEALRCE